MNGENPSKYMVSNWENPFILHFVYKKNLKFKGYTKC